MRLLIPLAAILTFSTGSLAMGDDDDARPFALTLVAPDGPVHHGQTIRVSVVPDADARVESVMLVGSVGLYTDDVPPFEFDVVVPRDAVGQIELAAVGKNDEAFFEAATVTLSIASKLHFEQIEFVSRELFIVRAGDTVQIQAGGVLPGGGPIVPLIPPRTEDTDLWREHLPVEFVSRDPSIVRVDESGVAEAVAAGTTTVLVRLGELSAETIVKVGTNNQEPVVDAGPDNRCVVPGSWVVLEGTARDPDGGPHELSISWSLRPLEHDFGLEHTNRLRVGLVAPSIPAFHAVLQVHDGRASVHDMVSVHMDLDADGFCNPNFFGQELRLEAEPFELLPEDR